MSVPTDRHQPSNDQPLRIKPEADMWGVPTPNGPVPTRRLLPPPAAPSLPTGWAAPAAPQPTGGIGDPQLAPPSIPNFGAPLAPPTVAATPPSEFGPPILAPTPIPELRRRQLADLPRPTPPQSADGGADSTVGAAPPSRRARLRSFAAPIGERRRHAAAATKVVAVGVSTVGFVAGIASLTSAHPDGEIQAASEGAPRDTIVETRTVHRTVYVDEHGNPVPEFDPSIAQAAIESAFDEATNATEGSPWAGLGMIPGVEASPDEVVAEESALADAVSRPNSPTASGSAGGGRRIPTPNPGADEPGDPRLDDGSGDEAAEPFEPPDPDESGDVTEPEDLSSLDAPQAGDPEEEPDPSEVGPSTPTPTPPPPPPPTTRPAPTTTVRATTTTVRPTTTTLATTTTVRPTTTQATTTTVRPTTTQATTTTTAEPETTDPNTTDPNTTDVPPTTIVDTTMTGDPTSTGVPTSTSIAVTTTRPATTTTRAATTTTRPTTTTSAPTTTCTGSKCHP